MTSDTTATPVSDVPAPDGAVTVGDWQNVGTPAEERYCEGKRWIIGADGDHSAIGVVIGMVQLAGGTVKREIALERDFRQDAAFNGRQARQLARTLICAADELDRLDG
jgi:hypothetical protein